MLVLVLVCVPYVSVIERFSAKEGNFPPRHLHCKDTLPREN